MGAPSDYQPIGPGGGKAGRLSKRLWQLVWLLTVYLAVYLAIAWWRGEPPTLFTVVNIVGLGAAALGMLGWKGSVENRLTKRLRELFQRGLAPEVEEVMAILEDAHEEDPRRTLTDYYAIGIITPEEYVREMVGLLEIEVSSEGGRAALLLVLLCLGASVAHADKLSPTLQELVEEAGRPNVVSGELAVAGQRDWASGVHYCHQGRWLGLPGAD